MFRPALLLAVVSLSLLHERALAFGFSDVVRKAQALSSEDFVAPKSVPDFLKKIDYDAYRDIRFNENRTLWRSKHANFDVHLIHSGFLYQHAVTINIYDAEGVRQLNFSDKFFDYGKNQFPSDIPEDQAFAGFKIRFPLNRADKRDELLSFVGASYFRALPKGAVYGLSARGLAIDTALLSGEEFPYFKEFWLERPSPKANAMRIFALLDSQRMSGAYEFVVYAEDSTRMQVKAKLFPRKDIKEVGIAPLTSMYHFGEAEPRPGSDWRPEVHDSDGLLIHSANGERLWRPLTNKPRLRTSYFSIKDLEGFGLLQRDRDFDNYQDLETHQERRPSLWVTPSNDWGQGSVKLTEIPTKNEYNDNIVAYWLPKKALKPGQSIDLSYQLDWRLTEPPASLGAVVTSTRIGRDKDHNTRRFVVEYSAPRQPLDDSLKADISLGKGGKLLEHQVYANSVTGGIRLSMKVQVPKDKPLEMRATLWQADERLSETWSYLYE